MAECRCCRVSATATRTLYSLKGMVECGRSDTDELSSPAWRRTSGQGRQASELRRPVSDPILGQTSKCQWWRMQLCSTHVVTCPSLSLVLQQEQCCSNQSVNSQRRRRVWPTSRSSMIAGYAGVDEVGNSCPRRYERRDNPDSDQKKRRTWLQATAVSASSYQDTCYSEWRSCDLELQRPKPSKPHCFCSIANAGQLKWPECRRFDETVA